MDREELQIYFSLNASLLTYFLIYIIYLLLTFDPIAQFSELLELIKARTFEFGIFLVFFNAILTYAISIYSVKEKLKVLTLINTVIAIGIILGVICIYYFMLAILSN